MSNSTYRRFDLFRGMQVDAFIWVDFMRRFGWFLSGILWIALALFAFPADAALLSYEPFDYTPVGSDLLNTNGGAGWAGPWYSEGFNAPIHNNYDIRGGSLPLSEPGTPSTGNSVTSTPQTAISGIRRDFAVAVASQATLTRYLSLLLRPETPINGGIFNGFFGVYLEGYGVNNNILSDDVYIGKPGGGDLLRWAIETRGGVGTQSSSVNIALGQAALLVLKIDFLPGLDQFTFYVNPTPGQPAPNTGIVKTNLDLGAVPGLVLYSSGAHTLDEIRWGETFADVVPVPEPTAFDLAVPGRSTSNVCKISTRKAEHIGVGSLAVLPACHQWPSSLGQNALFSLRIELNWPVAAITRRCVLPSRNFAAEQSRIS